MNFNEAYDRLISSEGGYVNNPLDPGGETKFGISKRSYPTLDIAALTRERAAEVADDGHIGPVTVGAVKSKSITDMLMRFIAERIDYWTRCSTWATFGKGWARRAAADLRFAAQDS